MSCQGAFRYADDRFTKKREVHAAVQVQLCQLEYPRNKHALNKDAGLAGELRIPTMKY